MCPLPNQVSNQIMENQLIPHLATTLSHESLFILFQKEKLYNYKIIY